MSAHIIAGPNDDLLDIMLRSRAGPYPGLGAGPGDGDGVEDHLPGDEQWWT